MRVNIVEQILGKKEGKPFVPYLVSVFVLVLGMNITGVIPFLNIAGTSVIGLPLVLAVISYVAFIYAGLHKQGAAYFKNALFPPGVPVYMYPLVAPIELISTFIIRPVSLTLRLTMNMVAGHMILVLCFSATSFFLLNAEGILKGLSVVTFAAGFVFTLFEIFIAVIQAYIFTLLTTAYIQSSLAEEH